MITLTNINDINYRAFGWVQDPSDFRGLCDVVAIFDSDSQKHKELSDLIIPKLVNIQDGQQRLIKALKTTPVKIKYSDLVGTSFTPRSISRCNGIIQAAIKGQKRDFIGDWPADNFLRWAHCLGFVKYDYFDDSFEITEKGLELTKARKNNSPELTKEEKELLIHSLLAYPPAYRILNLLNEDDNTHLTKFELGKQLGFVGEDGFTSISQNIFVRSLKNAACDEKTKIRANWEGSCDKYARMIALWLQKLELIERIPKEVEVVMFKDKICETIGHSYVICAKGIEALRKAQGKSSHKKIAKNVCWEMFSTKGKDRYYLRTRRSLILKFLSEKKKYVEIEEIINDLKKFNFNENKKTIEDDIKGMINIGIEIFENGNQVFLNDKINDFIIPYKQSFEKSDLENIKEKIREKLTNLPHKYLVLVDFAYEKKKNLIFEVQTVELLTEELDFEGMHLGGSNKPDGIIYTNKNNCNFGVIIDTKAYSDGYNLPISQADEMERYIGENQTRNDKINPNKWWENFDKSIEEFYFLFISGHFKGNFKAKLERISLNKQIKGAAINVSNILLLANEYKREKITHEDIKNLVFKNKEFIFE